MDIVVVILIIAAVGAGIFGYVIDNGNPFKKEDKDNDKVNKEDSIK